MSDKPKAPPGIRNFKTALAQVVGAPKKLVDQRDAAVRAANKRKRRKK